MASVPDAILQPHVPGGRGSRIALRPWLGDTAGRHALGLALTLAVLFTLVRAYAMLGPLAARGLFLLHCIPMALAPWLLLTLPSRREAGLKASTLPRELPLAIVFGMLAATASFVLGVALFGASADNWFVSVGASYRAQPTGGLPQWALFLMFGMPAMIFSPIGEEIFFRGYLQRMLETRLSARASTAVESAWFAGAHLVHHGFFITAAGLQFHAVSGMLWLLQMFALSCMFAWLRKRHDSIIPAILAHSGFNGVMTALIVFRLWPAAN